jgi:hypothetical protein
VRRSRFFRGPLLYITCLAPVSFGTLTKPTKVAGKLRRAVRSSRFAGILGGRHMECAYYFDFCRLCPPFGFSEIMPLSSSLPRCSSTWDCSQNQPREGEFAHHCVACQRRMLVRSRALPGHRTTLTSSGVASFDAGPLSGYGYGPTLTSSVVALGLAWLRDNDDAGTVGVVQGFFAVDQDGFAGFDGNRMSTRSLHRFNRAWANGRQIKSHVLLRFCDLH